MGQWHEAVVASLVQSKRQGLSFESAWARALREHRPRSRDERGSFEEGTLFDVSGQVEESLVEFTQRVCLDAWHGGRPSLRNFTLGMLYAEPEADRLNAGLERWAA